MLMSSSTIPITINDPINKRILAVSEDKIQGFQRDPIGAIACQTGIEGEQVIERISAMLEAGTIRRVRQTVMATSLAPGALVAWEVEPEKLNNAFDYMFGLDPFSGHVVIRSTDKELPGSQYRLWTTLKVPSAYSMHKHCAFLCRQTGASRYKLLPARKLFALGVGHVRRRGLAPGARSEAPGQVLDTTVIDLNPRQWQVIMALKREFEPHEIVLDIWRARAEEAGVGLEAFFEVAEDLDRKKVVGRFSTFLEHVKKLADGSTVTRYNALFHWAVKEGREMDAGREVGRHHIMTHAYWRPAGAEFNHVNVMGVAHGTDRQVVLAHKSAIDGHLEEAGISVSYTNVFWGGRSEIKPSEISPLAYRQWCEKVGLDEQAMRV